MSATNKDITKDIISILEDKKAKDIVLVDIREVTVIADYFVICHGDSVTQVKAIAEHVEQNMELKGYNLLRKEGFDAARWVLLDYGNIIVHIFYKKDRDYYQLERLWADGEIKYMQNNTI